MQVIGAGAVPDRGKAVLLQQVIDRDRPLMLDLGVALLDARVEMDRRDAFGAVRHVRISPSGPRPPGHARPALQQPPASAPPGRLPPRPQACSRSWWCAS